MDRIKPFPLGSGRVSTESVKIAIPSKQDSYAKDQKLTCYQQKMEKCHLASIGTKLTNIDLDQEVMMGSKRLAIHQVEDTR